MLDQFAAGTLPGGPAQPYTPSDTATFYNIYDMARVLTSQCGAGNRQYAGWSVAGK